ncbi:MAG: DUF5050 domain-containing protein [Verrucomicrobiota bacterium]|nr:DUF5050 domain-containing protein [Verrucomicrobiota bacterium]
MAARRSVLAVAGGTLYTTDFHSVGTLYRINVANGNVTSIGSSGLSYDILGSTTAGIYAVANDGGANLYLINPVTGAATIIGPTGLSLAGFRTLATNGATL